MKTYRNMFGVAILLILLVLALKAWLPPVSHSATADDLKKDLNVKYFTLKVNFSLSFPDALAETGIPPDDPARLNPCITEENFPNQRTGEVTLECALFLFAGSVDSKEAKRKIKEHIRVGQKGERYSPGCSRAICAYARDYKISELTYVISLGDGYFDESSRFRRSVMLWKNKCTQNQNLTLFTQSGSLDLNEYWLLAVKDD